MPHHTALDRIEEVTGVPYRPYLEFASPSILRRAKRSTPLPMDRAWISAYFRKEVLRGHTPIVSLRWIDDEMGWGVFAEKDFAPMEFIAEYTGIVRKRTKHDHKNAYCFEYLLELGQESPYLIDAATQGGISRYINHSAKPNLSSSFARIDSIPHILLYTLTHIPKGTELTYDYGPDYWKRRKKPR